MGSNGITTRILRRLRLLLFNELILYHSGPFLECGVPFQFLAFGRYGCNARWCVGIHREFCCAWSFENMVEIWRCTLLGENLTLGNLMVRVSFSLRLRLFANCKLN